MPLVLKCNLFFYTDCEPLVLACTYSFSGLRTEYLIVMLGSGKELTEGGVGLEGSQGASGSLKTRSSDLS